MSMNLFGRAGMLIGGSSDTSKYSAIASGSALNASD